MIAIILIHLLTGFSGQIRAVESSRILEHPDVSSRVFSLANGSYSYVIFKFVSKEHHKLSIIVSPKMLPAISTTVPFQYLCWIEWSFVVNQHVFCIIRIGPYQHMKYTMSSSLMYGVWLERYWSPIYALTCIGPVVRA